MTEPDLRTISAAKARPHRGVILRPGQPVETVTYPGDDDPESGHFAVCLDDEIAAVASLFCNPVPFDPEPRAWRIRGMGVYPAFRRLGYGSSLIRACIDHMNSKEGQVLWCNARTPVLKFYAANGFRQYGDEFEISGAGPHYVMLREVIR